MRFVILYSVWIIAHCISYGNMYLSDNEYVMGACLVFAAIMDGVEFINRLLRK